MPEKSAKANVQPVRQRTQYTCMAASMAMCLKAQGQEHCDEDRVNKVMGAQPMQGASWEQALACAQHYGMRATLVSPCTLSQLKAWTDKGVPVIIAWNPEGRDWSHASVVFDVTDDGDVYVADPNIPDPEETVRKVSKQDFYARWYEKWPNYLVRRVAMAIDREVTPDGRQVMASLQQPLMTRRDYGVQPPMKTSEMAQLLKTAENLPPDVERYVEEGKAQGLDEGEAWAVAWSRYCKYKNPGSEHCQKSPGEYFPGRKAKFEKGKSMTIDEVAEVVGPEFKEMNENPPDSVVKVREQMGKKASYPKVMKELKDDLDRKAITRSEFNELSEAVGNAETEQAARKIVQDHRKGRTAGELLSMDMFADMLKDSKFEKGKPADPTKNMSEEDAAEWERQNELNKDNFKGAGLPPGARDEEEAALVTQFFGKAKTAAGGKYGFTKATEDACGVGVNKLSKAAKRIAEALYAKDKESPAFLSKHAARSGNKAASMLLSAMSDLGPAADVAKLAKTAGRSGNGLYGFSEKTAKLALDACNALQHEAGVIAADLFARKGMNAAHLAGYLSANAKKAKCAFSQMLADAAPDVELDVEATVKKSGKNLPSRPKTPDKSFYVELDDDTNLWCVFGDPSGFCYSTHSSKADADKAMKGMKASPSKKAGDFLASEEEATEGEDWDAPGTPKC